MRKMLEGRLHSDNTEAKEDGYSQTLLNSREKFSPPHVYTTFEELINTYVH